MLGHHTDDSSDPLDTHTHELVGTHYHDDYDDHTQSDIRGNIAIIGGAVILEAHMTNLLWRIL